MRDWVVASALIEGAEGLLLVLNRRRDGSMDWSPPGGVVDEGETVQGALTREVREETGLVVDRWEGPVYEVHAEAAGMGWRMRVEVHRALSYRGNLHVDDPDGIVVDARYVPVEACGRQLEGSWAPLHEPLTAWLSGPAECNRAWRYRVDGERRDAMTVVRL